VSNSALHKRAARFGPFELDLRAGELRKKGYQIRLQNQPFQILVLLLENAGDVVTREQIQEKLWSNDTVVEFEHSIGTALKKLRQALGDDATHPRYIETLSRRGYRWLVPVEWEDMVAAAASGMSRTSFQFTERTFDSAPAVSALKEVSPVLFVGKGRELQQLKSYLETMLGGHRQLVFVTGEAGIGKTTLVDEFARQAAQTVPELRIARGQCVEGYGGKEAYYPVLEAVGDLSRESGTDFVQVLASQAPTWLVQFPALLTREHRDTLQREILGATRERMLREIGDALETISQATPLLLILEDLHWADHSTVDFISTLARKRGPARIMLVGTKRPLEAELSEHPLVAVKQDLQVHRLCQDVVVSPLSEEEVARYLAADSAEASLPNGLAALLHRHSGGNPLFLAAAIEHLTERGLISREKGDWKLEVPLEKLDLGVPQRLRRMIEAQIENLSAEQQRVLEVASVSGVVFETNVCSAAADVEAEKFEDLCEEFSRRNHFVRWVGSRRMPGGAISLQYEFVHAMYREVFYQRQAMSRRIKLHQRIGEQLEALYAGQMGEVGAVRLADHFEQAGDWLRAVKYLQRSADEIGQRFAFRDAAAILQHALELASKLPEPERSGSELQILEKLATVRLATADMRGIETLEALASRAAHLGLLDVEVRALIRQAWLLSWVGSKRSLEVIDTALQLSKRQEPLMRAKTTLSCFVLRVGAGARWNPQDAAECSKALAEISESGDRLALAPHLIEYSFMHWYLSEYREAHRTALEGIAILAGGDGEKAYLDVLNAGTIILPYPLFFGDWGSALREIESAILMADKNGDHFLRYTQSNHMAWLQFHAMDFTSALRSCELVFPLAGDQRFISHIRFCRIIAGSAEVALGNYDLALKHLHIVRDEMDRQEVVFDWYRSMMLESALTELWLAKKDLVQARLQAERLLKFALATPDRAWQAQAWETNARVALAEGNLQRAQECIAGALQTMVGFELPLVSWRVHSTASVICQSAGNLELAEHHRELSCTTILQIANSLPPEEPLRSVFLSAPPIRRILGRSYGAAGEN